MAEPRTYRFSPLDRTGWVIGLSGAQCVLIGTGILATGGLMQAGAPAVVFFLPLAACTAVAFASWGGQRLHERLPAAARFAFPATRRAWLAALPTNSSTTTAPPQEAAAPPFLDGLSIAALRSNGAGWPATSAPGDVGIVVDRDDGSVSASLPVTGGGFSLQARPDQERLVDLWGDVLGGFCAERSPVSRVRLTEWAGPSASHDHQQFLDEHTPVTANPAAVESYRELLADAAPRAVGHHVLVTVTVDPRRTRRGASKTSAQEAATAALLEQLALLASRLDAASLEVGAPLGPAELAETMRVRLDPAVSHRLTQRRLRLAELVAPAAGPQPWPLATDQSWSHIRTDGALHRTYWVAEWPRLDVPPNWLEPLLLHAGATRVFALHCEPVPPSRSRRQVDRDATRLAVDEEQRTRTGFRVGARHRRAQTAVHERESELVAGYCELEYAGFLTVTAHDEDTLARSAAEYEQAAAQVGIELRALEGRHDLGLACALPIGRTPATAWWRP